MKLPAKIGIGVVLGAVLLLAWALVAARAATRQKIMVPMQDGVRLATDLYLPEGAGPFPVVLIRTPYNKDQGAPIGQDGARRGYAVVCQDTRGRFASQGEGIAFIGDGWGRLRDGYDTLEWIAKQPWCDGKIGTWGGSALGITQIGMAGSGTTRLTCQHITVAPASLYHQGMYPGGVFKKALIEDWVRGSGHSPKTIALWAAHPDYDQFWRGYDLSADFSRVSAPSVFIGGWYDIFSQGTIDAFVGYQTKSAAKSRGRSKLVIGPWTHGVGQEKAGELTFRNGSRIPGNIQDPWRWFDSQLNGAENGVDKLPAVAYYVMGDTTDPAAPGNVWRTADRWPPRAEATPYYFTAAHGLTTARPGTSEPLTYAYDPKDPVPTVGGAQLSIPAGPIDQRMIEGRPDMLLFTAEPLSAPLEITGRVRVRLWASSDAPDTDFVARLCDVYPDGRSINVCEGALRARFHEGFAHEKLLTPGRIYPFDLDLWSTSIILNKGHRLRVQVTSSSSPGDDPNPNTGAPFRSDNRTRTAHNSVCVDAAHPSHILLPIIANGAGR
jgi:uncharacterized protein